jgi:prepilin-type N-terminal cleavage/methylation domain-containing protein
MAITACSLGRRRRGSSRGPRDDGFTLVELICAMFLFAVVLALISSATLSMVRSLRKEQGQSDNLDGARKAIELLDHQVSYANAVSQPGTTSTGQYIEFQILNQLSPTSTVSPTASGYIASTQTCYQWRLNTVSSLLQYRAWTATTGAATTTTGGWVTEATGAVVSGSTPVFATNAQAYASASATATATATATISPTASTITVTFGVKHGNPSTTTQNAVSLTALNTGGLATTQSVCSPTSVDSGALRP